MKTEEIIVKFKLTGPIEVKVDKIITNWSHLWFIMESKGAEGVSWRLVKYIRKNSPIADFKFTISENQAKEIIEKLSLIPEHSCSFTSWRRSC